MGEAKRRKQLGLMPTSFLYELELNLSSDKNSWHLNWIQCPQGLEGEAIKQNLMSIIPSPLSWTAYYRAQWIMSGQPTEFLNSLEDLETIKVPDFFYVSGELLLNFDLNNLKNRSNDTLAQYYVLDNTSMLRVKQRKVSFDGKKFIDIPYVESNKAIQYLMQHPISQEQGKLIASFELIHHKEGLVTINPEPPQGVLEILEALSYRLHGNDEKSWIQTHEDFKQRSWKQTTDSNPVSKRLILELRERPPLMTPFCVVIAEFGDQVFIIKQGSNSYSMDGENYISYSDNTINPIKNELGEFFGKIFDLETKEITVYSDGAIENEAEKGQNFENEVESYAAGLGYKNIFSDKNAWNAFSKQIFLDAYLETYPNLKNVTIPEIKAIKFGIPLDALQNKIAQDSEITNKFFIESQFLINDIWYDVFLEEIPEELK